MTFIDELLLEAEVKEKEERLEMSRLRADQILSALAVLEQKESEVNNLADEEIAIIEEYRQSELQKIGKKMSWLTFNLEQFMRSSDEKTMTLPHGVLKLRLGRDKVEVTDLERFINASSGQGLIREKFEPDLTKIQAYIKNTGSIPAGVAITPAQTRFSYTLRKGGTNGTTAETGSGAE